MHHSSKNIKNIEDKNKVTNKWASFTYLDT
jgi:hypothetical protein